MTKAPVRLQLTRHKGADVGKLSLKTNGREHLRVDRATAWGNHHAVTCEAHSRYRERWLVDGAGDFATKLTAQAHAVALHAADCAGNEDRIKQAMAGLNLACWCGPDEPCHADTYLRIANGQHE